MVYLGAVSIISAAYMLWREYSKFLDGEITWCRCFLAALTDYREKVKCYIETPDGWAREYTDEQLSSCGFLGYLADGQGFTAAYRKSEKPPYVTEATDSALSVCFARLGEGYIDSELETLNAVIDKLGTEDKRLSEALVKRRRALGAVMGAIASGIVILVM